MVATASVHFKKKLVISILVILLYFIWPTIIRLPLELFNINFENTATNNTPLFQLVYNMAFYILLMGILIIIYRDSFKKFIKEFKSNYKKYLLSILKYTLITIIAMPLISLMQINVFGVKEAAQNDMIIYTYFKQIPALMIIMTAICYPIIEEIVFNHTIKTLITNKWLYIIVSALFFWYFNIAYIGINYATIIGSFYYFVAAFIKAYAYYKTDNLLVPIGVKMIYNLFVSIIAFT